MLKSLTIQNFAIIESASIDFETGMTVFSGETGAGKSIIIDAIGILCGGRGSADFIRHGADRLRVEGLFSFEHDYPELNDQLQQHGIEVNLQEEDLIIQREINLSGKNLIRLNGQLANVTLLKAIGDYLVDIHGQNEHQSLLDADQHLQLLDQSQQMTRLDLYQQYQTAYHTYHQLRKKWLTAQNQDQHQNQRLQFLTFQIQEIEAAQLVSGQEAELAALSKKMQYGQQINTYLQAINDLFSENDPNILGQLQQVKNLLKETQVHLPEIGIYQEKIQSYFYDLQEIAHQIAGLSLSETYDSQMIDEVEARLSELGQLKHKYGMSVEELLAYYQEISEEVYQIQHREHYLASVAEELQAAYQTAYTLAEQLHQVRQQSATVLAQAIQTELADLYMKDCQFQVVFAEPIKDNLLAECIPNALVLGLQGYDQLEFYAATNPGEPLKPLVKVASGGELSRFMLALKRVFSLTLVPKTMIFDEIDTGVSGRVAQAIAEKMMQIATSHQVLCITHLAQVTAIAHHHLYISKSVNDQRTYTQVTALNEADREAVIAQMLSGKAVTITSRQMARELIASLRMQ